MLDSRFHLVAYNVGVNVGAAAGQSVFHAHIHVIPRYEGDVTNPLGGVRNVVKKSIVPYAGDGECLGFRGTYRVPFLHSF